MVAAGTIGYTLGSVGGWAIGMYGGRPYLDRHGRWLHLGPERLEKAERWFDRWGDATALIGRITPLARSFVSIPAGVFRMPLGRYTVLTFVGSTIWCLAFAGDRLGRRQQLGDVPRELPLRRLRRARGPHRGRDLADSPSEEVE